MALQDDTLPIAPAHSRDDLLAQLRQAIRNGALRPGARLPNERLVAERSGLSRSTVRVVFGLLEQEGQIVRHVGRGTYVRDGVPPVALSSGEFLPTPAELMEFRLTCEPPLVELVVLKSTDAQLEQLVLGRRGGAPGSAPGATPRMPTGGSTRRSSSSPATSSISSSAGASAPRATAAAGCASRRAVSRSRNGRSISKSTRRSWPRCRRGTPTPRGRHCGAISAASGPMPRWWRGKFSPSRVVRGGWAEPRES